MALTSEVTLPFSTILSALRLLADSDMATVIGFSKPESRDASERVRVQHNNATRQTSSRAEPQSHHCLDGPTHQHACLSEKGKKP